MKDYSLIGIIIGIAVILSIGFWEQVYLDNVSANMIEELQKAETVFHSGNNTESISIMQNVIKKWEEHEKILGIIINHDEIHRISNTLKEINKKIEFFYESNNISANFALVKEYIVTINEGNEFTISNVL